jgi:hypothetical protein
MGAVPSDCARRRALLIRAARSSAGHRLVARGGHEARDWTFRLVP